MVDHGGRWGSVARHVTELRGPCRPGGVGDGRVARCFHCCCRVESVPHGRDTADNLRESGGCSSFVEDKANEEKASNKTSSGKLPHVQRSVGELVWRTSAERRPVTTNEPVKMLCEERGGASCFGSRAGTRSKHSYLACKVKAGTPARQKAEYTQLKDATAKLDVPLGKLTHPPFGRARPKRPSERRTNEN